jgi:hypothetical protein
MEKAFQKTWQTLARTASHALRQAGSLPRETTIKSFWFQLRIDPTRQFVLSWLLSFLAGSEGYQSR